MKLPLSLSCFLSLIFVSSQLHPQSWVPLSTGTSHPVQAIASSDSGLYVGGSFYMAGGVNAVGIAHWNGSEWTGVGSPINGSVLSVLNYNNEIYIGGQFTSPGWYIAKWNGAVWSALGSGVNGRVFALTVYNDELYVGGEFTTAGGVPALNIAKWNPATEEWSAVGAGLGIFIYALAVYNGELYAGGGATPYLGKWDGTNWTSVGLGVNQTVNDFEVDTVSNLLYVGGNFTMAGGMPASRVASWNNSEWSNLGSGVNATVNSMVMFNSELYVGWQFDFGTTDDPRVARWTGSEWAELGAGFNQAVNVLHVYNNELYAGGNFTASGANPIARIARFIPGTTTSAQIEYKPELRVYPNPMTSQATLQFDFDLQGATVIIENSLGQVMGRMDGVQGRSATIHRNNLKEGLYFLKIIQNNSLVGHCRIIVLNH